MNKWVEKRLGGVIEGREGESRHGEMTSEQAGVKVYKTHLSLSTMEKVKAHDRYKHICYWVLQLLYFDGLVSTQVGSFVWMLVRVLYLDYSTVAWLYILHIHKTKTPFNEIQLQVLWLWYCKVQSGIDSQMGLCCKGSILSNESTHFWEHTKGMLGIIRTFFCNLWN